MMRSWLPAAIVAAVFSLSPSALAEPIAFGTSQAGGATYGIALALAKEAKDRGGLDIRATPLRSPSQAVSLVNNGDMQLAATSAVELASAIKGAGSFKDNAMTNLHVIGNLFPFHVTLAVKKDDPAQSLADLKGRRIPGGIRASTTGDLIVSAILAGAGLSYDDVERVDVPDYATAREAFVEGRVDVNQMVLGTGTNVALDKQVGGLRALGMPPAPDLDKRLRDVDPAMRAEKVDESLGAIGVEGEITVLAYDYVLYTHVDTPDEIVEKIAQALLDGAVDMAESVPGFKLFDPAKVASDIGLPFHPAAINFYKERGIAVPAQ